MTNSRERAAYVVLNVARWQDGARQGRLLRPLHASLS